MKTLKATQVRPKDVVTYCGATFVAQSVEHDPVSGLVRVQPVSGIPQYIAPEREVQVLRPTLGKAPKPYVVYTRLYKENGDCEKRIHRFATSKAQSSFMARTHRAITFHN